MILNANHAPLTDGIFIFTSPIQIDESFIRFSFHCKKNF